MLARFSAFPSEANRSKNLLIYAKQADCLRNCPGTTWRMISLNVRPWFPPALHLNCQTKKKNRAPVAWITSRCEKGPVCTSSCILCALFRLVCAGKKDSHATNLLGTNKEPNKYRKIDELLPQPALISTMFIGFRARMLFVLPPKLLLTPSAATQQLQRIWTDDDGPIHTHRRMQGLLPLLALSIDAAAARPVAVAPWRCPSKIPVPYFSFLCSLYFAVARTAVVVLALTLRSKLNFTWKIYEHD